MNGIKATSDSPSKASKAPTTHPINPPILAPNNNFDFFAIVIIIISAISTDTSFPSVFNKRSEFGLTVISSPSIC